MSESKGNEAIVERYMDQHARMPDQVRGSIEAAWAGKPVQLYAMADLDGEMRLACTWFAVGPDHVALARSENGVCSGSVLSIERARIKDIREIPGLSCTQIVLLGEQGESALASLRYTHRQRRAMENVKFLLKQSIEGHEDTPQDSDRAYAELMAKPVRDAQASVASGKLAVVWRLLDYMRPYRLRVACGIIGAFIFTAVNLLPPYLTGYLIDNVFRPVEAGAIKAQAALGSAMAVVACIGVAFVLRQFLSWVRMRSMSILGEYVARDLRTEVYEHLQKLSLGFFSSKQTGSIIARVSSDTDRLWDFIAWGAVDFLLSVAMLFGLGIMLLVLDWRLGLVMTVPLPFLFWAMFKYGRFMHRLFLRCWRNWSGLTAILGDTIPGVRIVKAFNQENREKERFDDQNHLTTDGFNQIHMTWTTFWPSLWFVVHVMMFSVWALAAPRVLGLGFGTPLSIGTFVQFVLYMGMFVQPVETIGRMTFILNRASSSAHRVFEVLDTEPAITSGENSVRLEPVRGHVVFENVSFAYDGVRQVLQNVSFEAAPGEMIGLVGPSGAGKSTVTNLIARFYDVGSGRITVDGVDIRDLDVGHYRQQLGIVLQEPHLFHGTILGNVRYGVPDATLDQVVEAARAANAHDFISELPHGYDTVVGERGHTLSGGERQRVSIARAILCNPRILILDEATSSVDTETEYKIQEALERLISGRTVFAIAHRLSTLRRASRLFVIEEGRITEKGTHEELLANPESTYTKLVEMQRQLHEIYVA